MVAIPTYNKQPQGLGGTVKLSGSDPVNSALQQLGGQMQKTAGVIKQYETIKDESAIDSAAVDRQVVMNHANQDFDGMVQRGEISIEEKPDFMRERIDNWSENVSENWKGSDKALEKFMVKSNLTAEREQGAYMAQVTAFEFERAIVNKQIRVDQIVYAKPNTQGMTPENADAVNAQYTASVEEGHASLERLVGPQKAYAHMQNAQTQQLEQQYVNINDTVGLDNAMEALNDPKTAESYQYLAEGSIETAKKKNRQQKRYVEKAIVDQQRENLYKAQQDIANGVYNPLAVEQAKAQGENATTPAEPVGLDPRSASIIEDAYQDQLVEQIPAEAWAVREKAASAISKDAISWGKRNQKLETLIDSKKQFFDKLNEMPELNAQDKYGIMMNWANSFKAEANPALHAMVTDAVVANWHVEAKLIGAGYKDVVMGGGLNQALSLMTGKETPDQMAEIFNKSTEAYSRMLDEVVLGEMKTRSISQPIAQEMMSREDFIADFVAEEGFEPTAQQINQLEGRVWQ